MKLEQYSVFKVQIKPAGFIFESSEVIGDGSTTFNGIKDKDIKDKYILSIRIKKVVEVREEYNKYLIILMLKK